MTRYGAYGADGSMVNNLVNASLFHTLRAARSPGAGREVAGVHDRRGNNKDFEFTLRTNAKFADGQPVDAMRSSGT